MWNIFSKTLHCYKHLTGVRLDFGDLENSLKGGKTQINPHSKLYKLLSSYFNNRTVLIFSCYKLWKLFKKFWLSLWHGWSDRKVMGTYLQCREEPYFKH